MKFSKIKRIPKSEEIDIQTVVKENYSFVQEKFKVNEDEVDVLEVIKEMANHIIKLEEKIIEAKLQVSELNAILR